MPLVMMVISSERVTLGRNGRMVSGASVMSHEDAGGDVERLDTAGAHEAHHHLRQLADDELHHAVVIQDGEERGDEDDDGQHLEGEDHAELRHLGAQLAEDKLRAGEGVAQKPVDRIAGDGHDPHAEADAQHQHGEDELQRQADEDGASTNGLAIGGEEEGKQQNREDAQHAGQTRHGGLRWSREFERLHGISQLRPLARSVASGGLKSFSLACTSGL